LLDSVKSGQDDVFTLLKATPFAYPSPSAAQVRWTQADYLSVAQAFQNSVSKDYSAGWRLDTISFSLDCKDVSIDPQGAKFKFFKIVTGQNEYRIESFIDIDPKDNYVRLDEFQIFHNYETLSSIDLSKAKITVKDALQIAEKNGGTKARLGVADNCSIGAFYGANSSYDKGWFVSYSTTSSDNVVNLLWEDIDAQTGKYQKIR
jgi:hypothetical protein